MPSGMSVCSQCGQPVKRGERFGLQLSALKTKIVDEVRGAGPDGIPPADLFHRVFAKRVPQPQPLVLKVHIWKINTQLEEKGWQIYSGKGGGPNRAYKLIRVALKPRKKS